MIPKKIYLTNKELQDTTTCERMVSINEPYRDMTEEYVNLSQVWHQVSEEPIGKDWKILIENKNGYYWVESSVSVFYGNWQKFTEDGELRRWAYIKDLLPK